MATAQDITTAAVPRDLISPRMHARLTRRITADHPGTDPAVAGRIVDQALAFLQACALNPGAGLAPSDEVDKGWHAFILFTADYAEFCQRIAGRFIHHLPVEPGVAADGGAALHATVAAMRAAGLAVDEDLWPTAADCESKCHQCHGGCYDSPKTS
jgi:hypothetical protein